MIYTKVYMRSFIIIILLAIVAVIQSQNLDKGIVVNERNNEAYRYPWAGGLNSCQFGEIDLDFDGVMDLFVFDRAGNRILTFINEGIPDSSSYIYAPHFAERFPVLYDWVILKDYNLDGKQDIFTYSRGFAGILVYKNTSDDIDLEFELIIYPFLLSYQGGGYTNILTTYADYPGIIDLDNDGDLDILTFWGLGSFVEFHKNQGIEKYGTPDSLDFIEVSMCWGEFAESDESNQLFLDTCFGIKMEGDNSLNKLPHTGSTFLVTDLTANGVVDLLLGDVDYPDIMMLENGGTSTDAKMISYTNEFPAGTKYVKQFSMPLCGYLDLNNDGLKDLVVSPFDPSIVTSENYRSIWFYKNEGENNHPDFEFYTDRFIQDEMIDLGSGAYPVLFDFTGDGLDDLLVGNYGYYDSSWYDEWMILHSHYTGRLAAFANTGTDSEPAFLLIDDDYANISHLELTGIVPAFADLDGDGSKDMLVGNIHGTLAYYRNISTPGDTCNFILEDLQYQNIDVGEYSAPQFVDLNMDDKLDLVIGERKGNLNYYRNTGDVLPTFTYVTDSLGKVNVTDYNLSYDGYSVPNFFMNSDKLNLVVGSEQGKIFYFKDIDDNLNGKFTESDSLYIILDTLEMQFDEGLRSAGVIHDINTDGRLDMIAGNYSGGLRLYSNYSPKVNPGFDENPLSEKPLCRIYPNPADDQVNIVFNKEMTSSIIQVSIYGITGSNILSLVKPGAKEIPIDVSQLENGIYFINVSLDQDHGQKLINNCKLIIANN